MSMKVFLSSTFVDLFEHRKKAIEAFLRLKCTPLAMEYFGSRTEDAETVCQTEILECDVFIGIYAHRFGFVPEGGKKSITRIEYEQAKEAGKKCLLFVVKGDYPWNPVFFEREHYTALQDFLEMINKDYVVDYFTSPEDLAGKLSTSLASLLAGHEENKPMDRGERQVILEQRYRKVLKEELNSIHMLGSPDIESKTVSLEKAFVSLHITDTKSNRNRYDSPEEVIKRAFQKYRLLLLLGDPGSGKTTLLKYYAVNTADKYKQLGFSEPVLPVYFPLRELQFDEKGEPASLPDSLAHWAEKHLLDISKKQFLRWLHEKQTLILLDGLDEMGSKEQRRKVCRWVKQMWSGLQNARIVITTRATGYRKLDGIELEMDHLRADILDFSPGQQQEFLKKWFRAVFSHEFRETGIAKQEWLERQQKRADIRSQAIIDFLDDDANLSVRDLASVPMLLQIMAIIWKDRQHLPRSRSELYDAALNYLLDYRDRRRNLIPVLRAEKSRIVLSSVSLWMQEKLRKDEVSAQSMHDYMQPILDTLDERPAAAVFCENLRDRAGLIAEYDHDNYIFRHKSFREFLAGLQLVKECRKPERIKALINHFDDDWWEETLRFFMSKSDDEIFDNFMNFFFQSTISRHLDAHRQAQLQHMVAEAPQKKIDALQYWLNSDVLNNNQRRYVMECLKTIGTPEAIGVVEQADKNKLDQSNLSYAEDIVSETRVSPYTQNLAGFTNLREFFVGDSYRNLFEGNVEYIKIPGGTYFYSLTSKEEKIPDLWFCKYLVTNKRYNRFLAYLEGKLKDVEQVLPYDVFSARLLGRIGADNISSLGNNPAKWRDVLRPGYAGNKNFNEPDQPVVGVSWYSAQVYCFWLTCLEGAAKKGRGTAAVYSLPVESQWEWAAARQPGRAMRKYPWPDERGEPNPNLANFDGNVGTTTTVGRYPDGATPDGLLDMAGNVWEWMGNLFSHEKLSYALRGGSWDLNYSNLHCNARLNISPGVSWSNNVGFRVIRQLR